MDIVKVRQSVSEGSRRGGVSQLYLGYKAGAQQTGRQSDPDALRATERSEGASPTERSEGGSDGLTFRSS